MEVQRFKVFADYFQIVLEDENCDDDFSNIWNESALERMLALGTTSASLGTLRNIDVDVELHIVLGEPTLQLDDVDHAAFGSFSVPSGQLVVMGCTDYRPKAARIAVLAGTYQILTTITGANSIKYESGPADDLYSVYLWPGGLVEPRLLKHWRAGDQPESGRS